MASSSVIVLASCLVTLQLASCHYPPAAAAGRHCKKDADCKLGICIGWHPYGRFTGQCREEGAEVDGGRCSRNLECQSHHCLAGHCYSRGKECSDNSVVAGCDFVISVEKYGSAELGIDATIPSLEITSIGAGLVRAWNKKHPKKQVKASDRIVSVNGSPFWSEDIFQELKKDGSKRITLMAGTGKRLDDNEGKWQVYGSVLAGVAAPTSMACLLLGLCGLLASGAILVHRRRRAQQPHFLLRIEADPEVPVE